MADHQTPPAGSDWWWSVVVPHLPSPQPLLLNAMFVGTLYVFYAPFREATIRERHDNAYAQLVKLAHAWTFVVVVLFHLLPSYMDHLHRAGAASNVGIVFMLMLTSLVLFLRAWHWAKRRIGLAFTYAPTVVEMAFNAVAIACVLTVQHAACLAWAEGGETYKTLGWDTVVCNHLYTTPSVSMVQLYLYGIGLVLLDYAWKQARGQDPKRGFLAAAVATPKERAVDEVAEAHRLERFLATGDCSRPEAQRTPDGEGMVSWYSLLAVHTGLKAFVGTNFSFGRFDYRTLEPEQGPKTYRIIDSSKPSSPKPGSPSPPPTARPKTAGDSSDGGTNRRAAAMRQRSAAKGAIGSHGLVSTPPQHTEADNSSGFWFDWVADIGDGFNSTYEVAAALAQPTLRTGGRRRRGFVSRLQAGTASLLKHTPARNASPFGPAFTPSASDGATLPRGRMLILGGDLCYPMPTTQGYYSRFFKVYNDALPQHPRKGDIGSALPSKKSRTVAEVGDTTTLDVAPHLPPAAFAMTGNHDWIDGLETYRSTVLSFDHMGGWRLPQVTSYFAFQLPGHWWMLCLDNGMGTDIDQLQLQYFLAYVRELPSDASVVLSCHDPNWINDALTQRPEVPNTQTRVSTLAHALGVRLRVRLCGDIHNYTRYEPVDEPNTTESAAGSGQPRPAAASSFLPQDPVASLRRSFAPAASKPNRHRPIYVVSGGGGAFLHGTSQPGVHLNIYGEPFRRAACFPEPKRRFALSWISRFRLVNWKFDIVGTLVYCAFTLPLLPVTTFGWDRNERHADPAVALSLAGAIEFWKDIFALAWALFTGYHEGLLTSSVAAVIFALLVAQTDVTLPKRLRVLYATGHFLAHLWTALLLLALFTVGMDRAVALGMLRSGVDRWDPATARYLKQPVEAAMDWCGPTCENAATFLNRSVADRVFTRAVGLLDPAENFAYYHAQVTLRPKSDVDSWSWAYYYTFYLWFYWLFAAPAMSFVLGMYLTFCTSFLSCSMEHAFAALQIEDWKNFIRMRIDPHTRRLRMYVIGFERVPRTWKMNPRYEKEREEHPQRAGHEMENPSRWIPGGKGRADARLRPRIVDEFDVEPLALLAAQSNPDKTWSAVVAEGAKPTGK